MVPSRVLLKMRYRLEYFPVWLVTAFVGVLPRPLARCWCQGLAMLIYGLHGRLRRVGMRNLDLAFPAKSRKEKKQILRGLLLGLGRQLAECCFFPRYTEEKLSRVAFYDGFEHFAEARARGKG